MFVCFSLETNDTVALERAQREIENPEANEHAGRDVAPLVRSAELAADRFHAPQHHDGDGHNGERAEHGDGEGERAGHDLETRAVVHVVEGGKRPR